MNSTQASRVGQQGEQQQRGMLMKFCPQLPLMSAPHNLGFLHRYNTHAAATLRAPHIILRCGTQWTLHSQMECLKQDLCTIAKDF